MSTKPGFKQKQPNTTMSLYESNLGKRDAPCNDYARDTATSSIQQIVDVAQVSGGSFDADAGKFENFPEIT